MPSWKSPTMGQHWPRGSPFFWFPQRCSIMISNPGDKPWRLNKTLPLIQLQMQMVQNHMKANHFRLSFAHKIEIIHMISHVQFKDTSVFSQVLGSYLKYVVSCDVCSRINDNTLLGLSRETTSSVCVCVHRERVCDLWGIGLCGYGSWEVPWSAV